MEQSSLFEPTHTIPLAVRMRPNDFDGFVGQQHLLQVGGLLRVMVEHDRLVSAILFGPPGTGKTTLAHIISQRTGSHFVSLNAVNSGTPEIKKVCDEARQLRRFQGQRTLVFIDEIHRFNKLQQDALLPEVESGGILLLGASTQNPSFALVPALLSRTFLFELQPLQDHDIAVLLQRGAAMLKTTVSDEATNAIIQLSSGDGRRALNLLEGAALVAGLGQPVELIHAEAASSRKAIRYDKNSDNHYDYISAFIKSVRGSDPDAAIYYLAVMLEAGEDPMFIARRLAILAAEDIGNAAPNALTMAAATLDIVATIGMPEARIPLAQMTLYLALSPKSNSAYLAIDAALNDVRTRGVLNVPSALKNGAKRGESHYLYPHDFGGFTRQHYLSAPRTLYEPVLNGYEIKMAAFYQALWGDDESHSGT
ncbi:replication-associated recombination protein A [Chrysiogenes arsenatis]|uniref:replication-associated recombination protein A n=1 Tax=Chrysiogenes arsenatis TaxID=309797 RepID=UPI0004167524|nr:replication-associated recombination protein A [Chrysiogenes arsenatis]